MKLSASKSKDSTGMESGLKGNVTDFYHGAANRGEPNPSC